MKYPAAHQNPAKIHKKITGMNRHTGIVINALTATLNVLMNIWSLIIFFRKISGTMNRRAVGIMDTMNSGRRIRRPSPRSSAASRLISEQPVPDVKRSDTFNQRCCIFIDGFHFLRILFRSRLQVIYQALV